jgi:adenosylmethionine-8-amino-7-oxononanoate aminotransferase
MSRSPAELRQLATRHLWGHFSRLDPDDGGAPIMERGEGCSIFDVEGNRYLDALAGLFTVQVGHGRAELADAAGRQGAELGYFPIWTYAHPNAIELAARLASLAPGDLNRVFFTTGGGEAVESAWKLARQYFKLIGQPMRTKAVTRYLAYHGTTMGALSLTGVPAFRQMFEPLVPGVARAANTNRYRCSMCATDDACNLKCADDRQ